MVDRVGPGRQQQRVTIGLRLGHQIRRNQTTGTGTLIHHHLLPPAVGHLATDNAREHIGAGADNQTNRFVWKVLRRHRHRCAT